MINEIIWQKKLFKNLTTEELYKILKIRQEVFVVEQKCFYQDLDNKDFYSVHLIGYHQEKIVAYLRIILPLDKKKVLHIGRVLTAFSHRKKGLGRELMLRALKIIETEYGKYTIVLAAQLHLQSFYESFGFVAISEPYDEDGIMHIDMRK